MLPTRRRRLFVDLRLQGSLLLHATIYWFYCLLSVAFFACCWIVLSQHPVSSGQLFRTFSLNYGPALLGSILLMPLVLMDCLRLSNRMAGPTVRLRKAMRGLADGEFVSPVKVREDDFWADFAKDLNRVVERFRSACETTEPAQIQDRSPCVCVAESPPSAAANASCDTAV